MKFATSLLCAAGLLTFAPPAQAQPEFIKDNVAKMIRKIGVHANTSFRAPTDSDVKQGRTYGLSVGVSPGKTNGWRYPVSLSFFSERLNGPSGRQFAKLRGRAILAGIGYGWHFGKLSTGASFQAGYANYRLNPEGDALSAFNLASGDVTMDVNNTWLLRPQLKAEYFLTRKFTVRISGDYVFTRPDVIVTTPSGRASTRWDASNFHANIGIGVYPFHK